MRTWTATRHFSRFLSGPANRRLLELKDMPVLPFKRLNPAGSEVLILRPLVDLTPSYLTALAADGAI